MTNTALRWTAAVSIAILATVALCAHYVHVEHPAYVWDFVGYWDGYQAYGYMFSTAPLQTVFTVFQQIRVADYSPAPIIALIPFYFWFGENRTAYITAIAVTYLIPAAAASAILVTHVMKRRLTVSVFLLSLSLPAFWMPSLRGQPDIVGIIFLAAGTVLLFKSDFLSRRPLVYGAAIGLAVYAPFLLRRWYAYSIVLFFASAFAVILWRGISAGKPAKEMISPILGLGVAGAVFAVLVMALQWDLALRAVTTSYADLHSAYQTSFVEHLQRVGGRISVYVGALTAIGAFIAVRNRNFEAIFCLLSAVGTFLLFTRTQYMGLHHSLPVFMWLLPLMCISISSISRNTRLPMTAFAAFGMLILAISLSPLARNLGAAARIVIPYEDLTPLYLENLAEYKSLATDIERYASAGEKAAVFASSRDLSDSLLMSLNPNLKTTVIPAPHIAATQGFPPELLDVDLAVVATPDQQHLAPGSQENILTPGRWIIDGAGFGRAFVRKSEYHLQNGVTAFLYQKARPVTEEEKAQLLNELARLYPDHPSLFPTYGSSK